MLNGPKITLFKTHWSEKYNVKNQTIKKYEHMYWPREAFDEIYL